jgi:hypothetical protein
MKIPEILYRSCLGPHSGGYEEYHWDITPCSRLSADVSEEHIAPIFLLATCFDAGFLFARLMFSTLKMGAICSSETSVDTQRTTTVLFKGKSLPKKNERTQMKTETNERSIALLFRLVLCSGVHLVLDSAVY